MVFDSQDSDTNIVKQHYAVIYAPSKKRKRFPENCVTLFDSASKAIQSSQESEAHHPALVLGPSRSSEGFKLFYLFEWLD